MVKQRQGVSVDDRAGVDIEVRRIADTKLVHGAFQCVDIGVGQFSWHKEQTQRAAALANAYVDELNSLAAELSTSSAHRERIFLEERLKVAKKDLDEAANELSATLRLNPSSAKAHVNLAALLMEKGKLDEAQTHFEQALRIEPNNAE